MPSPSLPPGRGVLIARPEPGLSETMQAVRDLGWLPFAAPALRIVPRVVSVQAQAAFAVLTSSQAIPALAEAVAFSTPVYAVGDATARRVRDAGFLTVTSAGSNAAGLAELMIREVQPAGRVLLLSGAGQGVDLATTLREAGFRVSRRVAYDAQTVRELPEDAAAALRAGCIRTLMAFSSRSATATTRAVLRAGGTPGCLRAVAISDATAATLQAAGFSQISVAAHPDAASMLTALGA